MKLPCYLVRDLLPLYRDHVCDGQTAADVAEHLEGCPACAALLKTLEDPAPDLCGEKDAATAAAMTSIRQDLRRRQRRIAALVAGVFLLLAALAAAFYAYASQAVAPLPERMVPVFTNVQTEESGPDEGGWYVQATGDFWVTMQIRRVTLDGQEVLVYTGTTTLWRSLFGATPQAGGDVRHGISSGDAAIQAIYYVPYQDWQPIAAAAAEDAVLQELPGSAVEVWQR